MAKHWMENIVKRANIVDRPSCLLEHSVRELVDNLRRNGTRIRAKQIADYLSRHTMLTRVLIQCGIH